MEKANITLEQRLLTNEMVFFGSRSLLEAILANLLTNAIKVLKEKGSQSRKKQIAIVSEFDGQKLCIHVMDSGPGIVDFHEHEIWLPGVTGYPDGTGLGLTIVRDSVRDLGGMIKVVSPGELGGAEFIMDIPV